MQWLAYALGLVVGTSFGFWVYRIWEHDLAGVGAPKPPVFDLYVPLALFIVATGILVARARREGRSRAEDSRQ